jgi:hypothetical protein
MTSCNSKPSPPSSGPAPSASAVGPAPCPAKPVDPWIQAMLAKFCPQDKAFLEDLKARGVKITAYDSIDFEDNYYDGKQWVKKLNPGGGQQDGNNVIIVKTGDPGLDASTMRVFIRVSRPTRTGPRWSTMHTPRRTSGGHARIPLYLQWSRAGGGLTERRTPLPSKPLSPSIPRILAWMCRQPLAARPSGSLAWMRGAGRWYRPTVAHLRHGNP